MKHGYKIVVATHESYWIGDMIAVRDVSRGLTVADLIRVIKVDPVGRVRILFTLCNNEGLLEVNS